MNEHATPQTHYVVNFFNGAKNLTFVEIGANDGTSWSCSYHLENDYDWNGLCIEPHPTMFKRLTEVRKCDCLNAAISNVDGELDFFSIEGSWEANMLSGLVDNYCDRHRERIMEEYKRYGGVASTIKVKCLPLSTALRERNITKIDYLSIDTEGSEAKILESIDFSSVDITLIGVEVNYGREEVEPILIRNGYKFIEQVVGDAFYCKADRIVDSK